MKDITVLKIGQFTFTPAVEREDVKGSEVQVIPGMYAVPGGGFASYGKLEIWAAMFGLKIRKQLV